jgi:hypothetical protein
MTASIGYAIQETPVNTAALSRLHFHSVRFEITPFFLGSSFASLYSRPSEPMAVAWVTYSPDFA